MVGEPEGLGADGEQAFVARVIPYGEADLVVHLVAEHSGNVPAMARGARARKSRYRARIEPWSQLRVVVRPGRGELARLADASSVRDRPNLRRSWTAQQTAARALDLLWQTNLGAESAAGTFNMTHRLLDLLDDPGIDQQTAAPGLLSGYLAKLLVLAGATPRLDACVRCGATSGLRSFSIADGGLSCISCAGPADRAIEPFVREALTASFTTPLSDLVGAGEQVGALRTAFERFLGPLAAEHLGMRVRVARPSGAAEDRGRSSKRVR